MRWRRNDAGYDALRTAGWVQGLVKAEAEKLEAAANSVPSTTQPAATEPYYVAVEAGDEHRARYRVRTDGPRAVRHEAKTDALLRGLSSG